MNTVSTTNEEYHETELGILPTNWQLHPLGHLYDVQSGKALAQRYRQGPEQYPFLRTSNVYWEGWSLTH
jgi:hypothetical protein